MKTEKGVPFLDLKRIHDPLQQDFLQMTKEIIDTSQFVLGKSLRKFEEKFSDYVGSSYGAGVGSGADALFLTLKSIGLKDGDEVITVNNTFNATVDAIIRAKGKPKIVDVFDTDLLMNLDGVRKIISKNTKAIIPVHLYGNPVNMKLLTEIRDEKNQDIKIIQDAAQAHGSTLNNKKLGEFGDILCYSFYPGKNLGGLGEGGFIASDDPEIIEKVKILRNCGQKVKYKHTEVGYNSRMDNLQAAFLLIKLRELEKWNQSRREAANKYYELLENITNIKLIEETKNHKSVYHLFVIRVPKRSKLIEKLKKEHIGFGIHYPIPINKAEAYHKFEFSENKHPVSEKAAKEIISLPIFPYMNNEEITKVVNSIRNST